ncbi:hypothetical protein PF003_g18732 [Phytophthora fragariae]|nr:hypothetical protein PF003_g18732 [Phytophthora fragariae]
MDSHVRTSSGSRKKTMMTTWSSMGSHVRMSSGSPPKKMMMWLSVVSHSHSSMGSRGWSSGSSPKKLTRPTNWLRVLVPMWSSGTPSLLT